MDPATLDLPDFTKLSEEELDDHLALLCSNIYAAEYQLLLCIREWDKRCSIHVYGVKSTAHWLNARCGIAMGAAREKVRVARALEALPKVSELFAKGQLSYSKVRALTRVATPENEDYLIGVALQGTASHLERLTAAYRKLERLHDPERLMNQRRMRHVKWYWDEDGTFVFHGRLSAEDGALFIKCVEAMRNLIFREERAVESEETFDRLHGRVEKDVEGTTQARRADALLRLLETGTGKEPVALTGPERIQVVLHVPVAGEPTEGATGDSVPEDDFPEDLAIGRHAHLEPGPVVAAETARRLCCDAARVLMVENGKGEPLSVGRRQRTVTWAIRQALMYRDGGCTFPGCMERRYVDAHHIQHWADGGETSLENCTLLCRHHHRLVHEEGFGCERSADGSIVFRYPDGGVVPKSFRLEPGSYRSLADRNRQHGIRVSAETAIKSTVWGHGADMSGLLYGLVGATRGPNFEYPMLQRPTL